jgi:hypothetical protein
MRAGMTEMQNTELDSILGTLRDLFAAEYERGQKDQLERIVRAATSVPASRTEPTDPHKMNGTSAPRASRGAPDALIRRVLREAGSDGISPAGIKDRAIDDDERTISFSGIRFALARGRSNGEYVNRDGKWYLPAAYMAKSGDAA